MRKIDLLDRAAKVDNKILALSNSGRKMYPETLTCKDLKRLNKAFDTIYELFDKCMVEEKNE
ncbi:hypothetical protein [Butyrivibrio sp. INlla21]|uniref:hypothetical protein n=1 Tax=Butyrivibrio sp. INlla21 TaxID=1520811 RepID=UPI0008E89483|nr:hypothetical protein [Butyrivibrio sp. INlla21]SFU32530.1 hypothetical protein SAMN02910342_00080 [Butyrivibrio sp. INlla21]